LRAQAFEFGGFACFGPEIVLGQMVQPESLGDLVLFVFVLDVLPHRLDPVILVAPWHSLCKLPQGIALEILEHTKVHCVEPVNDHCHEKVEAWAPEEW
jgi:hypothetical protein